MNDEEIKEGFIQAFGIEKWEQEEMLGRLIPIQQTLCKELRLEMLPVICEEIEEDSRIYLQEKYIVLSPKMLANYNDAVKSLVHEIRHQYQLMCCITGKYDKIENPRLILMWMDEFTTMNKPLDPKSDTAVSNYLGLAVELDAHAYSKWYLKERLGIETHYPNPDYDAIIDEYIEKIFMKK